MSNAPSSLRSELELILRDSLGERAVSAFLGLHPEILRWAVCWTGGHNTYVLREFPLGSQFRADFIVITSYSGTWEVHVIELEPHDDHVFTQAGLPSSKLNTALRQINDWEDYIERNPMIRADLARWCVSRDILGLHTGRESPTNYTGNRLNDIDSSISYHYYIFIGNRASMTDDSRKRRHQIAGSSDVKIFSYSRLVDIAGNIDRSQSGQNVLLTQSDD